MTRLLAHLPLRVLHALGRLVGWAIYGISPTYRRHLRENLAAAGYREPRLRRAVIAEAGKMPLETPRIWLRPRAETLALLRGIDGLEHYEAARAAGKAIMVLTPHIGCFDIVAQAQPSSRSSRPAIMRTTRPCSCCEPQMAACARSR